MRLGARPGRRAGVPEYAVWEVMEHRIRWFRLHDRMYVPLQPDTDRIIEGAVFPGLRLAADKMLAGDRAGVLAALEPRA